MCLKRYARIRNSRGDETRLTRTLSPSACVFRRRTGLPPSSLGSALGTLRRHALTQPIPNPYEGSFNSNLPFRDCSESCIFLSRTNVYHSITNRETFVPVSRPTFRLAWIGPGYHPIFPSAGERDISLRGPENPTHTAFRPPAQAGELNFNFEFFDDCVRRAFTVPLDPPRSRAF